MCMFGVIVFVNGFVSSYTVQLVVGILTGVVVFFAMTSLFKFGELRELLLLVRKK